MDRKWITATWSLVCIAGISTSIWAQVSSFNPDLAIVQAQIALPSEGPASSRFNPAALGDSPKGYGHMGISSSVFSTGPYTFWQVSGALAHENPKPPLWFAAGLGGWSSGSEHGENFVAIFERKDIFPSLAGTWSPGYMGLSSLSLGLAIPVHQYQAFEMVRNWSPSFDWGLLAGFAPGEHSLQVGLAYHNFRKPEVQIPTGGWYKIPDWAAMSLAWLPPGRWARLHWEWYFPDLRRENFTFHFSEARIHAWELELRPIPWLGVKFERLRLGGLSTVGFVLRPEYGRMKALMMEVNTGHRWFQPTSPSWLFGNATEERPNAFVGFSLGAGI